MKTSFIKGFTLIELLVVITIIGILATGWVTVFTSQLERARDSTRITDIAQLQGAVEQYNSDSGRYPQRRDPGSTSQNSVHFKNALEIYLPGLFPQDPRHRIGACRRAPSETSTSRLTCAYMYWASNNSGIDYELATRFESAANVRNMADNDNDGGNDNRSYEVGINIDNINTNYSSNWWSRTIICRNPESNASCANP